MKLNQLLREANHDQISVGIGLNATERMALRVSLQYYRDRQGWEDHVGRLEASRCGLTSLEGSPTHVLEYFKVIQNPLKDLKGGPTHATGYLAKRCELTSLEGAPMVCGNFNVMDNQLTSLAGIGQRYLKQCMKIALDGNPIKSHILGLMLVKDLENVLFDENEVPALSYIVKHLDSTKDVMECKEEMMEAGLREYAKL